MFRKLTEVFKDPSKIRVHRCLSPPTERPSSPATRPALPPPLMLKPGGDTGSAEIRLHRVHALDEDDDDEDSAAPGLPKKSGSLDDIPHHDVEKMVATVAVGTEQDEELEVVEMAAKKVDAKAAETQGKSRANTVTETRKDSGEQKEEAKGEVRPGTSAGGKAKKESKKIQQRKKGPAAKGEKKTEPEEKKAEKKEEQPLAKERASLGPDVLRTTPTEADQSVRQKTSSSFVQPQLQSPNEDAKKGKAVAANKAQTEGKKCETSKGKPLAALSVSLADGSAAKGEGGNEKHAGAKEGAADMAPALGEKRVAESSGKSETAMVVGAKKTATATVKSQGPTAPAKAEAVKEVVTDKKLEKSSEGGNIQRPTQAKEVGIVLSPEAKATTTTAARQVNNKKQDTKRLEKDVSAPKLNEAAGTATIAAAEKGASAQTRAQHKVDSESAGVTKRGEVIPARSAVAGNNSGSADKSNQAQRSANTANKTETGIVAAQKTVIDAEEASPRSSDEREEGKVVSERATEGERNESVAVPKTEAVPATKDDVSHRGEEAKEKTAGSAKVLAGSETEEKSGPPGLGESHLNVSERKQDSAGREEGCEGGARHEEGKDVRKTESGDKVVETESETAVKPQTETDAVPPPQCDTEITLSPAKAVSPTEPNNDIATGKSAAAGEEHVAQAKLSHDTKNRVRVAAEDRERTVKDHQSEDKEVAESQNAEKNGSAAVNGTDTGIAKDSAKATHAEEETTARICGTFGKEGNSAEDISQSAAVPRTGIAPVTGHDDTTTQEKSPVVVKSSCEGPVQQENDSDRGDAHDNPQCETAARPEEQKAHAVDAVCEEDTRKRKAAENSEKRVPEAESRDKNDTRDASTKGKVGSVTDRISEEVEKVSNVTGQQNLERSAPGDGLEIGAGKVLRKTEGHHAEVVAKTAGEENSSSVVQTEDAAVAPKNGSDKRVCEPQNETRKVSGEVDATEEARTANVRKAAANGEAANPCREYTANPHSAEETGTDKRDAVATTIHEESHDQPGEESTVRPVAAEQGATPIVGTMREKSDEVTRIVAETAEPIAPGSNKTAEKNGTHEASGECSSQEKAEAPLHSKSNTLDECQNISATKQNENRGPEMKHDDDDDDTAVLPKNKSSLGSPAGHTNKGGEGPESQVAAAKRETDTVLLSAHPEEASRKARQMADTKGLAEEKNHAKIIIESGPAETAALLANKDVRAGVEVRGKAKDAAEKGTELADLMRSDNVQPARNALRQAVYHDVQSAKSGDDEPDSVTEPQMPKPIPSDVMRSAQPGIVPSRAANANVTAVQESILPAERSVRGSNPFVAPADVPTKVLRSAMPLPVNGNIRNPGVDSEKTGDNPMLQVPTAQDQQDYHASTALAPADQTHLAKTASQFARISPHTEREAGPSHGESDLNISSIEPSAVRNPSPLKRENSLELMIESMMNDLQELGVKNRSRSPVPERKHTPEKRLSAAPIPLRGKRTRRQNPNEFRYSGRNKAPLTRTQLADMSLDFSAKKSQSPSRVKVLTFGVAECGITQKDHDFATHPRQPYPSAGQDAVSGTSPIGMQLEVDSLLPITQERGLRNSRPLSGVSSPAPMRNVVLALSRRAIKKSGQYNIISPFIARSFVGSSAVSGRQSVSRSMRMNSMMSGTYSRATVGYSSGYGQIRKTRGKPEKHIRGLQNHGNTSNPHYTHTIRPRKRHPAGDVRNAGAGAIIP